MNDRDFVAANYGRYDSMKNQGLELVKLLRVSLIIIIKGALAKFGLKFNHNLFLDYLGAKLF